MKNIILFLITILPLYVEAVTVYNDRSNFLVELNNVVTDDYESDYTNNLRVTDIDISRVLGETSYISTGHSNNNSVTGKHFALPNSSNYYCAGCNGSFLLDFTDTSVGDSFGVFGVGIDIRRNIDLLQYVAFVTYGDLTTDNFLLPLKEFEITPITQTFWGITSISKIKSIHFGLIDGGITTNGSFSIDNLSIGSNSIPEPATILLLAFGLAVIGIRRKLNIRGL